MADIQAILVTGAGRGIGRAISLELGSQRAHVVCLSRSENAERTAREIRERGGSASAIQADLRDASAVEKAVGACALSHKFERWGAVLAAGTLGPSGPLVESDLSAWMDCFAINVLGNLAAAKALLEPMLASGFGRILAFAGGGSAYAYPLFPAYSASKTAMVRAMENLNCDVQGKGDFAVACLAPGAVDTDMLAQVKAAGAEVRTMVPIVEPVTFAREFVFSKSCGFSGSFVHVRDKWPEYLNNGHALPQPALWKLRRIEP